MINFMKSLAEENSRLTSKKSQTNTSSSDDDDEKEINQIQTAAAIHHIGPKKVVQKGAPTSIPNIEAVDGNDPFEICPATPDEGYAETNNKNSKNLKNQTSPNRRKESLRSSTSRI